MQDNFCLHCFVSGHVQGVWYRASTQKVAQDLGLTGWVRNLEDGRVEVLACGKRQDVLGLYEWLKLGPPKAIVTEVTYEEMPWLELTGFDVV